MSGSSQRSGALELAILGVLHETPLHGYELRKRLSSLLGAFRALGYGSLYPALKDLLSKGLIAQEPPQDTGTARTAAARTVAGRTAAARTVAGRTVAGRTPDRAPRRSRIVYRLTAEGKERLNDLLGQSGPAAWEDEGFGVHFAFFGLTQADIRMRILEGRRSRLEERLEGVRAAAIRTRERVDRYTLELQRHGLESVEREVRWLNELIASERRSGGQSAAPPAPAQLDAAHTEEGGATTVA